jgi:hypothetical protein
MLGNDIQAWEYARIGIVFEGLLGMKPAPVKGLLAKAKQRLDSSSIAEVDAWEFDDIAFRSLKALETKGYQVALEVYTFLGDEFAERLDSKLGRWGVSANSVLSFMDPYALARYLRANLTVTHVYTANTDWAAIIGPRATVRQPGVPLGF